MEAGSSHQYDGLASAVCRRRYRGVCCRRDDLLSLKPEGNGMARTGLSSIHEEARDRKVAGRWASFVFLALLAPAGCRGEDADRAAAIQSLRSIGTALEQFRREVGRYPTEEEGFEPLHEDLDLAGWNGPYLDREILESDPWGHTWRYRRFSSHRFDVLSSGADGLYFTEDDLSLRTVQAEINRSRRLALDNEDPSDSWMAEGEEKR
jgi:hypothetical protein